MQFFSSSYLCAKPKLVFDIEYSGYLKYLQTIVNISFYFMFTNENVKSLCLQMAIITIKGKVRKWIQFEEFTKLLSSQFEYIDDKFFIYLYIIYLSTCITLLNNTIKEDFYNNISQESFLLLQELNFELGRLSQKHILFSEKISNDVYYGQGLSATLGGEKGAEGQHGTKEERDNKKKSYQIALDDFLRKHPDWKSMKREEIQKDVAKIMKCSARTIRRYAEFPPE